MLLYTGSSLNVSTLTSLNVTPDPLDHSKMFKLTADIEFCKFNSFSQSCSLHPLSLSLCQMLMWSSITSQTSTSLSYITLTTSTWQWLIWIMNSVTIGSLLLATTVLLKQDDTQLHIVTRFQSKCYLNQ